MLTTVFETFSTIGEASITQSPTSILKHEHISWDMQSRAMPIVTLFLHAQPESQFTVQSILQCMSSVHESSQDSKVQLYSAKSWFRKSDTRDDKKPYTKNII